MPVQCEFFQNPGSGASNFYDYQIQKSVRIDKADTSYLAGPTVSSSNNTKYSLSFWVKRGLLGISQAVVTGSEHGGHQHLFDSDDTYRQASFGTLDTDPAVYQDTTGWYHFFVKNGTSDGTGAIYVNGVQQTLSTNTWGNVGYFVNGSKIQIGASNNGTYMFDGYIAEINAFYDQTKAHTDFGEFKNGVWIPKEYTGSFGNSRDFQLKFLQTGTSADASGIGADTSGNGNHFSVVNMAADHVVIDSPTNGAGSG